MLQINLFPGIMMGMERQTSPFIGPVPEAGISSLPQGLHPMEWVGAEMALIFR
jgi:hypothetical protein